MSQAWLQRVHRAAFGRPTPQGSVGWHLLCPGLEGNDRLHRQLWWQAPRRLPRLLWLLLELWLYLRWQCWLANPACQRALARHGSRIQQQHQLSTARQNRAIRQLARKRCWPPYLYYTFQLYLPDHHPEDYVLPAEMAAYHRYRDGGHYPAELRLLADKQRSLDVLSAAGIANSRTLQVLTPACPLPEWQALGYSALFLKPRDGSQSQHCYRLELATDGSVSWFRHPDGETAGVEAAWLRSRQRFHYLIQPYYRAAAALQSLSQGDLTLRVITRQQHGKVAVTMAWLEIETHHGQYQLQALTLADGQLLAPDAIPALATRWQQDGLHQLPHWHQAASNACAAHTLLSPNLHSVAWDFVLPEEGAVLLEGNSTWNVVPPQQLFGGLLSPLHPHNLT